MDINSVATFIILFLTGQAMDPICMFLNRSLRLIAATALLLLFLFAFRSAFNKDVAGKVILITGAYSGIRKHLAYSYAKRGACLALVGGRENRLRHVTNLAYQWDSPDVVIIQGDVSMAEDCERLINQTIDHCGCLDHLMTNARIALICMFEDCLDITKLAPAMVQVTAMPMRSVEVAAEEMVKWACRGDGLLDGTSAGGVDLLPEGVLPRGTSMVQQVAVVGWDQDLIEECPQPQTIGADWVKANSFILHLFNSQTSPEHVGRPGHFRCHPTRLTRVGVQKYTDPTLVFEFSV